MKTLTARGAYEHHLSVVLVASLGLGAVLLFAAAGAQQPTLAMAGAGISAVALLGLASAGWIDPFLLVLIAAPLPAVYSDGTIRIAAVAPITALSVTAWFLQGATTRKTIQLWPLPVGPLFFLCAALMLATLTAESRPVAVRELFNLAVLGALLIAAVNEFSTGSRKRDQLSVTLGVMSALCGALALLEAVGVLPGSFPRSGTNLNRAALGFGQPNALGLFLAAALPFAAHLAAQARGLGMRVLSLAALASVALGLIATFSRGSWLGLMMGSLVLLLTGDWRYLLRIWVFAVIAVVAVDVISGGLLVDTARRTPTDWVLEQRIALMVAAFLMFQQQPWLGVGPGGFAATLERVGPQFTQLTDYQATPHNAYLQMAAETGSLGLVAFLVFLTALLMALARNARETIPGTSEKSLLRATVWSYGAILGCSFSAWPLGHGTGQIVVLIIAVGLCAAGRRFSSA